MREKRVFGKRQESVENSLPSAKALKEQVDIMTGFCAACKKLHEDRIEELEQEVTKLKGIISGLTLRDLFAMCYVVSGDTKPVYYDTAARNAYEFADSMIKYRKNEK